MKTLKFECPKCSAITKHKIADDDIREYELNACDCGYSRNVGKISINFEEWGNFYNNMENLVKNGM